jgi:hypothetical protein
MIELIINKVLSLIFIDLFKMNVKITKATNKIDFFV